MIYLKRIFFTIFFLFLFVGYSAQQTMSSKPSAVSNEQQLIFQVMESNLIISKSDIQKIQQLPQKNGQTQDIEIQLTDAAAKRFYDFTGKHAGQRMQIIWNGTILSEAVIMSALPGNMVLSLNIDNSLAQEIVSSL